MHDASCRKTHREALEARPPSAMTNEARLAAVRARTARLRNEPRVMRLVREQLMYRLLREGWSPVPGGCGCWVASSLATNPEHRGGEG